ERMSGVEDQRNLAAAALRSAIDDFFDLARFRGQSIHVDGNHCADVFVLIEQLFEILDRDIEIVIDLGEYRNSTGIPRGLRSGDEGEAREDNFLARLEAERTHGEDEAHGARGDSHGARPEILARFGFELVYIAAEIRDSAVGQNLFERSANLIKGRQIGFNQRYFHLDSNKRKSSKIQWRARALRWPMRGTSADGRRGIPSSSSGPRIARACVPQAHVLRRRRRDRASSRQTGRQTRVWAAPLSLARGHRRSHPPASACSCHRRSFSPAEFGSPPRPADRRAVGRAVRWNAPC